MSNNQRLRCSRHAFTLLEIIIVMAVAAVLIGLCIPYISGMLREQKMREPVRELQALAKALRSRAMTERVPYEILFNSAGFLGSKHLLYTEDGNGPDGDDGRSASPTAPSNRSASRSGTTDEATDTADEPLAQYPLPPEMKCRVLFWGTTRWIEPVAGNEEEPCRWVFQPSGLCNPIRVQFHKGDAWIEAAFNPLTADIQEERYLFPD